MTGRISFTSLHFLSCIHLLRKNEEGWRGRKRLVSKTQGACLRILINQILNARSSLTFFFSVIVSSSNDDTFYSRTQTRGGQRTSVNISHESFMRYSQTLYYHPISSTDKLRTLSTFSSFCDHSCTDMKEKKMIE